MYVPKGKDNNKPVLINILAWHLTGDTFRAINLSFIMGT